MHSSPYNDRGNLLAREQATGQNIVWGTGTHTTPVNVFAWGPPRRYCQFRKSCTTQNWVSTLNNK
ncbi:hypothetical protein O9993_13665 [Vibrio lentus]|nr:hypothetical protein [Vibrio lentus]